MTRPHTPAPVSTAPAAARLTVATDGSALGNPGPGGWSWAAQAPGGAPVRVWAAGALEHTTNNFAELVALQQVLESVPAHIPMLVLLDSTYVRDIATKWRHGWRRRGWKTAAGTPVKNKDIIQHIDTLLETRDVQFQWVKAHLGPGRGNPLNDFVDHKARAAARTVRSRTQADVGPGWPTGS